MIPLPEYYDMLARHDWFYEYSDDNAVWRRGVASETAIREATTQSPAHAELYQAYHDHISSGPAFKTPKAPKPARPS